MLSQTFSTESSLHLGKVSKHTMNLHKKVVLVHAMKALSGKAHRAPLILNLGIMWRVVVGFMPWLLYRQQKCVQNPLNMRLGGP
jgi:hypothetical protein